MAEDRKVEVRAEITANVWQVLVEAGSTVDRQAELAILESMKMEIPVLSPVAGTVDEVRIAEGDAISEGDLLVVVVQQVDELDYTS